MKRSLLPIAAITLLVACTPEIYQRGYLSDPAAEATIKAGKDTKTSVQDRLGYASTTATFNQDSWYYVSSVERQVAFFHPTVQSRTILAVYFDKDGKVTDMTHYSLRDGHIISIEARITPTRGREMTFLQQLLNATPQSSTTPLQDQTPGGGGGAPGSGLP